MSKRPDEANERMHVGKISRLYFKEEFDLGEPASPPPARNLVKWLIPIFPIAIFCAAIGLAVVVTIQDTKPQKPVTESLKTQAFRWAVNRAMNAAELTQTATSKDEWSAIATWWEEAIELMKAVPKSHPKYQVAQDKVEEYQQKLNYAQSKIQQHANLSLSSVNLWSVGSRRIDILRIQGEPTHEARYDSLCQEVMYYGNSMVELSNGVVVKYEDLDKNLKASQDTITTSPSSNDYVWTLGSAKEDVFRVQGTPDRLVQYESLRKETLYYGNSIVELTENRVTGYSNLDNTLRVAVVPIATGLAGHSGNFWSIGSDRNDVFRVQGTPTQVSLDNSLCRETLHYGNSTVELKNGFVTGYDNLDRNLRVRVR